MNTYEQYEYNNNGNSAENTDDWKVSILSVLYAEKKNTSMWQPNH